MIAFRVPGRVVAQGSMKAFLVAGKPRVTHSNATDLKDYRGRVAMAAEQAMTMSGAHAGQLFDEALRVDVCFTVPRPKNHYGSGRNLRVLKALAPRHKITAPDLDKLIRSLLDALTGVAFDDDAQVTQITATKGFTIDQPETYVQVRPLEEKGEAHG